MNDSQIRIIAPLEEAITLTKKILFQPFAFEKWLVLGFAAFLMRPNIPFNLGFRSPQARWRVHQAVNLPSFSHSPTTTWVLIGIGILFFLAFVLLLSWVSARGRFVFIDNLVHDRAAIVAPWKEYRREGNSFLLFLIAFSFFVLLLIGASVGFVILIQHLHHRHNLWWMVPTFAIVTCLVVFAASLVSFAPPVMYRQRGGALDAARQVVQLIAKRPGTFILFFLFLILLQLGVVIAVVILTCLTCLVFGCLAFIPYIGSVVMLPISVCFTSYHLCFLRQFGEEYDVWDRQPVIAIPPPLPPSVPPATGGPSPYAPPGLN